MTDLPTSFWGGWIVTLTVTSMLGLAWLAVSVYFSKDDGPHDREPIWDETLSEGSNPAPMWWFWMLFAALIFSAVYLMLYPGLGTYKGILRWSQGGRVAQSQALYVDEFSGIRSTIADAKLDTLRADDGFMSSAQRIFDRHCAACHGYEASGQAQMFPNLIDDNTQWGDSPSQVEQTIRNGRQAVMVGWLQTLGEDGVKNVAAYVQTLADDVPEDHPGQEQYNLFCVACHGIDGTGNIALGAPNLIDNAWLYGGETEQIRESISDGRGGVMPAFEERLDDTQIRLLVAWLTKS